MRPGIFMPAAQGFKMNQLFFVIAHKWEEAPGLQQSNESSHHILGDASPKTLARVVFIIVPVNSSRRMYALELAADH